MHLVLGSRVVTARSSSSRAPGIFFSFLTRVRMAFSHILLWFDMDWFELLSELSLMSPPFRVLLMLAVRGDCELELVFATDDEGPITELGSTGFTLKPRSFLTIAGVMYKLEKWVVSIDIFKKDKSSVNISGLFLFNACYKLVFKCDTLCVCLCVFCFLVLCLTNLNGFFCGCIK